MPRSLMLLACGAGLGVALALTTGGAAADQPASCPQLADASGTDSGEALVCCFENLVDESCTINAPSRNGCDWTMAYQCPEAKYTCDDEAKLCKCDAPADGAAPAP